MRNGVLMETGIVLVAENAMQNISQPGIDACEVTENK